MKTIKVAICIPVYGMSHAKFTQWDGRIRPIARRRRSG